MYFETTTCVFRQWILKLLHVCPDNGLMSNTCLFNYFQEKSKLFFAQASALLLLLILIKFVNTLIYMMNENIVGTQYYLLNKQKTMGESVQLGFLLKLPIFVPQKAVTPKNGVELCQKFIIAILVTLCIMQCCLTFWDTQNIWNI